MGLKWLLLSGLAHFSENMKHAISTGMISKSNFEAINTFFKEIGAHMNILFIIKVKILMLIRLLYIGPPNMLIIESRMVIDFFSM